MAEKKKSPLGGYAAILFAMLMMFSYSIPWLRETVGSAIDKVFGPLLTQYGVPFFILIVILSTLTGLYSSLIQKYTIDYEKMQRVQAQMKEFQREFREAQLSGDEKRIKKMQARQSAMMGDQARDEPGPVQADGLHPGRLGPDLLLAPLPPAARRPSSWSSRSSGRLT